MHDQVLLLLDVRHGDWYGKSLVDILLLRFLSTVKCDGGAAARVLGRR